MQNCTQYNGSFEGNNAIMEALFIVICSKKRVTSYLLKNGINCFTKTERIALACHQLSQIPI
jgi:hypothetical protein